MSKPIRAASRHTRWNPISLATLIFFTGLASSPYTIAATSSGNTNLDRLLEAKPGADDESQISVVRQSILRKGAQTLATQTGMIDRAREIMEAVEVMRPQLDKAFRFGDLVMGAGVLPPVISSTRDAAVVQSDVMRLAGAVYRIEAPARFFTGAPNWRDWLLMGLLTNSDVPALPSQEQLLPRNAAEKAFWQRVVKEAYEAGRKQAQFVFEDNLGQLQKTYLGMRTYYDLYQRGMVSAPVITREQDVVNRDDPNTIVVGDTVFRITLNSNFDENTKNWRAMQATPKKPIRLIRAVDTPSEKPSDSTPVLSTPIPPKALPPAYSAPTPVQTPAPAPAVPQQRTASALQSSLPSVIRSAPRKVVAKPGDTLGGYAVRYNIPLTQLLKANGMSTTDARSMANMALPEGTIVELPAQVNATVNVSTTFSAAITRSYTGA